jgi:hypothetical protein
MAVLKRKRRRERERERVRGRERERERERERRWVFRGELSIFQCQGRKGRD